MSQIEFNEHCITPGATLSELPVQIEQSGRIDKELHSISRAVGKIASNMPSGESQQIHSSDEEQHHLHVVSDKLDRTSPEVLDDLAFHFPELKLTQWEKILLQEISNTGGSEFRSSDLYPKLGDLSHGTKKRYTTVFMRKIRESPYADLLSATGATAARKYTWLGVALSANAITTQEKPVPIRKVSKIHEASLHEVALTQEATALSFAGIDMGIKDNKKVLSVENDPLQINDLSVEVLIELAMHEGRMTLGRLARSKRLQAAGIRPDNLAELYSSLAQIKEVLETHGISWTTNTLHIEDRTVTRLGLGDAVDIKRKKDIAEQTDYLRFRGLRLPKGIPYKKVDQRTVALMLTEPDEIAERLAEGEDYRQFGLCKLVEPEAFWPEKASLAVAENAKNVCRGCKVGSVCLSDALGNKIDRGVWGGLSERERRKYLRKNPNVKKFS